MRFTDKVAVVTGGGSGIGRATALALAQEEARIVVVDIDGERADQSVQLIANEGGKAITVPADLTQKGEARRMARVAVETYGGIDRVFHSVGIQTYGTVTDTSEKVWDRTLGVNLKSMYLVARFCIPEIIKRGGGAVLNVASVQGLAGSQKGVAAYAASKAGAVALSRSMALDYAGDNVRVNVVCPGSIDTPMLRFAAETFAEDGDVQAMIDGWGQAHPIGRVGQPEDIARAALFLLSDEADFISGAVLVADGGLTTQLI